MRLQQHLIEVPDDDLSADFQASRAALLGLWAENASPWVQAIRGNSIESRRVCTDAAVVNAVLARSPTSVLDIGCGEGWLSRRLAAGGVRVLGVDPVDEFVRAATECARCRFEQASTADLGTSDRFDGFDVWVCNFSLFHPLDAWEVALAAFRRLLPGGALVIQTMHSNATRRGDSEPDGWQPGSWAGCTEPFRRPIPWFYRTPGSWRTLMAQAGFARVLIQPTVHPTSQKAASLMITASRIS